MTQESYKNEPFILFLDGPLDRVLERIGFGGNSKIQVSRRIFFWIAIVWLPPEVSTVFGSFFSAIDPKVSLLYDFSFHVRCLIAIPILVASEAYVQARISGVIKTFYQRGMITESGSRGLKRILTLNKHLRKSILIEILLIFLSLKFVSSELYLNPYSFTSLKRTEEWAYLFADAWNHWIGLTTYYFFLMRWLWRFILWCQFLLVVATIAPNLQPLHPDKLGGLSFLLHRHVKFSFVALAISSVMAANITELEISGIMKLDNLLLPLLYYVAIVGIIFITPLFVFTPLLVRSKRSGLEEYGNFSYLYTESFRKKWIDKSTKINESPLGDSDIQSLSDLQGSYENLGKMRLVLMNRHGLISMGVLTVSPLLPLALFKFPARELFTLLAKFFI